MPNSVSSISKLIGVSKQNNSSFNSPAKSTNGFFGLRPPTALNYSTKQTSASYAAFSSNSESKNATSPNSTPKKLDYNMKSSINYSDSKQSSSKVVPHSTKTNQVPELELENNQILTIKTYCDINTNFDSDSTNSYAEINPKSDKKEALCLNENFYNSVLSESGEEDEEMILDIKPEKTNLKKNVNER
jgi:hypothetical protein